MLAHPRFPPALLTLAALVWGASWACAEVEVEAVNSTLSVVTTRGDAEAVQPDGKLLVATFVRSSSGDWRVALRRFSADGAADAAYDARALDARQVDQLVALPNGQTLVTGFFGADPNANAGDPAGAAPDPMAIVRLNADGSLDETFQPPALPVEAGSWLQPLPGGGGLISSYLPGFDDRSTSQFSLSRLTAGGEVDPAFHASFAPGENVRTIEAEAGGRLLCLGDSGGSALFRLNADGSRDDTFRSGLPAGVEIGPLAPLPDGRLLVAFGDDDAGTVARLNADGSVDPGFNVLLPGAAERLLPLADGSVLVMGDLTGPDGSGDYGLYRIDSAGNVTTVWDPASPDELFEVALLAGGGFAVNVVAEAEDGTRFGVVETFDAAGTRLARTPLGGGRFASLLRPRPDGGLYVDSFSPALLDDGPFFGPPPSAGVAAIKAGPTVRIEALRSAGYAGAQKKAKFMLTRTGDLSKDLEVVYAVKGTAVSGQDYRPLRGRRIIKAGRATAKIKVRPIGPRYGRVRPGGASIKLILGENPSYNVAAPAAAKVRLRNHRTARSTP